MLEQRPIKTPTRTSHALTLLPDTAPAPQHQSMRPPTPQAPDHSIVRKRLRKAYVLHTRKYIVMQPQKVPYRNPSCATCNHELESRKWRVRSETNYGETWHPRCFATAWPTIDIHCPPDTPPEISTVIQKGRQQPEPAPMDQSSRTPLHAHIGTPASTPENPN